MEAGELLPRTILDESANDVPGTDDAVSVSKIGKLEASTPSGAE